MMTIDAHQHFWELGRFAYEWLQDPSLEPIRRNFLPDDLRPLLQAEEIERSIFVQTQHDLAENRWVLGLAEQSDFMGGVIGWVDLASPACERQLQELLEHPKFVGVRHVTHDEPDDDFIVREDVLRGLRVLEKHRVPFDLLFFVKHLHHAAWLAQHLPELPLVIDHLAKPPIREGRMDGWLEPLRAAAKYPHVYCKLSGMVTEADWQHWQPADLKPYVDVALDAFGPARCMFGSDWPVCQLAGRYGQVCRALRDCLTSLSESEQAAIWGGTAQQVYGLRN